MNRTGYRPLSWITIICGVLLAAGYTGYRLGYPDNLSVTNGLFEEPVPVSVRLQAIQNSFDRPNDPITDPSYQAETHKSGKGDLHNPPRRGSSIKSTSFINTSSAKKADPKPVNWTQFQEIKPFSTFDAPVGLYKQPQPVDTPPRATPTPMFLR